MKKNELLQFLLSRCLAKELITKAEVLNSVLKDYQEHFLVVFGQASEYLQLVFGLEVKEVEEEDEEEQKVEKEEEDQQQQQVEGGGASRERRCSYLLLLLVRGTLEEVAAAATPSLPQSPLGVWPTPNAMVASPGSQYEEHGLSRQDEVLSTSRDQEDARSWL